MQMGRVWQALNHYAYIDAVFLAERLYAEGKAYKAYRLLKTHTCSTPQCRYLLAKCCVDLSNVTAG
ncbi:hypothetical protein CRUP_029504 [Coryphaenoides rupestris]|nr:hypothetical protein CRUP_029504 [Coryphaenoides rupestris]